MADHPLILLVDDEPEILDLYSFSLQQAGFEVVTASNGEESIKIAGERHPSLILMDMKMPGMSGVDAFMKLQADPKTKDIKVVFLSAFSDPTNPDIDARAAHELGAVDYLRKGLSLDEFTQKVKQYFEK